MLYTSSITHTVKPLKRFIHIEMQNLNLSEVLSAYQQEVCQRQLADGNVLFSLTLTLIRMDYLSSPTY